MTPPRTSSSTSTRANAVEGFTRRAPRRAGPRQRASVSGSAATASSRSGSGRRTGSSPSTGSSGVLVTSSVNSATVARPQANGSSGRAAASATPAAMPTELSSAEETTHGRPCASATSSAARTPPERLHLEDDDVARLPQVDPQRVGRAPHHLVGGDAHVDPAAQRDQLLERGAGLLDVLQADAGRARRCGRPRCRRPRRRWRRPGSRRRARGRRAPPRPGRRSSAARLARLGDLHLGGAAARGRDDRVRPVGVHGGDGHVDRHRRPQRRRPALDGGLDGGGPPPAALGHVVVPERGELAPAGRAAHQHAVADVDAAEAGAQRHRPHAGPARSPPGSGGPADGEITPPSLVRATAVPLPVVARHLTLVRRTGALRGRRARPRLDGTAPLAVLPAGPPRSSTPPAACCARRSRSRTGADLVVVTSGSTGGGRGGAALRPPRCGPRRPPPSTGSAGRAAGCSRCRVSAIAGLQVLCRSVLAGRPATVLQAGRDAGRRGRPPARPAAGTRRSCPPSCAATSTPSRPRCAPSTPSWSAAPRPTPRCSPGPGRRGSPS